MVVSTARIFSVTLSLMALIIYALAICMTELVADRRSEGDSFHDSDDIYKLKHFPSRATFEVVVFLAVWFNTLAMGVETDYLARKGTRGSTLPVAFLYADAVFVVFFLVEISIRILGDPHEFVSGPERLWNIFDFVLVVYFRCRCGHRIERQLREARFLV